MNSGVGHGYLPQHPARDLDSMKDRPKETGGANLHGGHNRWI
jgi:hypothetical protein